VAAHGRKIVGDACNPTGLVYSALGRLDQSALPPANPSLQGRIWPKAIKLQPPNLPTLFANAGPKWVVRLIGRAGWGFSGGQPVSVEFVHILRPCVLRPCETAVRQSVSPVWNGQSPFMLRGVGCIIIAIASR
jgi:hypothetical protein